MALHPLDERLVLLDRGERVHQHSVLVAEDQRGRVRYPAQIFVVSLRQVPGESFTAGQELVVTEIGNCGSFRR
jgi:hypothetical protein